jgi:hypothetical protein
MYQELVKWRSIQPEPIDGVIVGCDAEQEWMLTWWWMHYRLHNDYPVTFFNFGNLSPEAENWCRKKGALVDLTAVNDVLFGSIWTVRCVLVLMRCSPSVIILLALLWQKSHLM